MRAIAGPQGRRPSSITAGASVISDMPHSRHDRAAATPTLIARKFHLGSRPLFDNRRMLRKLSESSTTERRWSSVSLSIAAVAGICELGPYLYRARCRL